MQAYANTLCNKGIISSIVGTALLGAGMFVGGAVSQPLCRCQRVVKCRLPTILIVVTVELKSVIPNIKKIKYKLMYNF